MRRLAGLLIAVALLFPASELSRAQSPRKLLFLTHAGLYKHPSLEPAERAVIELGRAGGFEVTTLEGYKQNADALDLSMVTADYLAGFDGLMLMTNGNLPFTDAQKRAIMDFVRSGKALIGTHCATLTQYNDPAFGEMFGAYYLRSIVPTNQVTRGRVSVLKVEDPKHPATKMLGPSWPLNEELYEFGRTVWDASRPEENVSQVGRLPILLAFTRERVNVLLSLDTEHTDLSDLPNIQRGGDYPQAWSRSYGSGRVFYTSLGHREDIWGTDPVFRAHIRGGIRWALGIEN